MENRREDRLFSEEEGCMRAVIVTLTLIYQLFAADKPFQEPYLRVFDDKLHADQVENHEQALINFKEAAVAAGYRDHYHFFRFDDGFYPAFNPQTQQNAEEASAAAWAEIADKMSPALLKEGSDVFGASIEFQNLYTLARRPDYSYPGEGLTVDDFVVMDVFSIKHTHVQKAVETLKKLAALAGKQRSPFTYTYYSKLSGSDLPVLIRFSFAKNRADFEQRFNKAETLLGPEGRDLQQALASCLRGQARRTGWYRRAASY